MYFVSPLKAIVRFIDLSTDGGCSKKAHAKDLRAMLDAVATETGSADVAEIARNFTDAGFYQMQNETLVSTVDIVLPFIDDPILFGEIAVQHALNDIYASLAVPLGALIILGIPTNLSPTSQEVVQSLSSAVNTLKNHKVTLLGGHSLAHQQDFSLGFSIFGKMMGVQSSMNDCKPGDAVIITKRLGTSIASLRWRMFNIPAARHSDVIAGMRQSNEATAGVLLDQGVNYCTDISGFGLINNLHNLLRRCNSACTLDLNALPVYSSIAEFMSDEILCTRQYYHNADNIDFVENAALDDGGGNKIAWLDSQISGGLLFVCPASLVCKIQQELNRIGTESTVIGSLTGGEPGRIKITRANHLAN